MGFLDAYRVVDFTNERGLLAGRMLADLGADVVQVEPPEGSSARRVGPISPDGESLYWDAYAANKRGVTCDLDRSEGRDLALRLCAEADFVFESETPGVMARRGLAYEDVRAVNPRVVYTSITPFGSDGPKAGYADSEIVLWAAGGPLAAHRDGDRPPLRISVPQAYLHGAADAAGGALIAHLARRRTGVGQHVDVSVTQSVTQATLSRILATAVGDPQASRLVADADKLDLSGSGSGTAATKWRVRDGYVEMHLAIGPAAGRFTNNLFAWLREEGACDEQLAAVDWAEVPKLVAEGAFALAELERARAAVADFLARRTKRELIEASLRHKLLAGPILTVADIAESPQLEARSFWVELGEGERRRVLPGAFAHVNGDAYAFRRPAPRLGEHNAEVFGEVQGIACDAVFRTSGSASRPYASPSSNADYVTRAARTAARVSERALSGVRVLDICWVVAGPAVGRALADYGAEVIRVESATRLDTARLIGPFHGGTQTPESSILYGDVNAGKLGLTLNLKLEPARDVVRDLVRRSDVVLDSFSPGVMQSWGLGYEQLRALNEGVIVLSTSLMGQTGPYGRFAGYGNIGAAMSGFQSLVGWPDRPPFGPYGPYSDYVAPRFALVVLLAALGRRLDTGEGCYVDVAQVEAAAHFLAPQLADYFAHGRVAERLGNRDRAMAPHGVYACADGAWVAIAVRGDEEWCALAELFGLGSDDRFRTTAGRLGHADELDDLVGAWAATRTAAEVEAFLQERGVPAHAALSSETALDDPQLAWRRHFVELEHPLFERTVVQGSRFRLSETPAAVDRPAPTLGRDNERILRGILGYDHARIAYLGEVGALT